MRVPPTLRDLGGALAPGTLSEQDRQLIDDELSRAHASLAQALGELQAGMIEIESLFRRQTSAGPLEQTREMTTEEVAESKRSVVWQKS